MLLNSSVLDNKEPFLFRSYFILMVCRLENSPYESGFVSDQSSMEIPPVFRENVMYFITTCSPKCIHAVI